MYHYVEDKQFLKQAYGVCADIVNQLVQRLKGYDIEARMNIVGSKSRNMVTQNGNGDIDFDFNLIIEEAPMIRDCKAIKEDVMDAFNGVLKTNGWRDCKDSTSAITTCVKHIPDYNVGFKIDVCIVKFEGDRWYRLIHKKTGLINIDEWCWEEGRNSAGVDERARWIKEQNNGLWDEVRAAYLEKKNMYLSRNDHHHKSFICYIEAVNEIYYKYNNSNIINSNIINYVQSNGWNIF